MAMFIQHGGSYHSTRKTFLSRRIVAEALTSMSADDGYQHQRMLEGKADAVVPFPGPSGSLLGPGASTTTAGGASAFPSP